MSVEYTYDEENNVLYTRFYGVVVDLDLRAQAEAVGADPRIKPGAREMVDLSGIEDVQASPSALEQNIMTDRANSEKLAGLRTAIVAETDFLFGFARMYQSLAELEGSPTIVGVFRTVSAAREWLGLEDNES